MTFYQLRAINPDGSSPAGGGLLPDFEKLSLGIMFSDVGSLTFDYAVNGVNAGLVTEQREIAVYDHAGEVTDARFVIESSNGERWNTEGVLYRSFTCRSWWKIFEEGLVYGVNWPTVKTEQVRQFSAKTPGEVLKTIIDKAQSLGEMTGLTYTFSNTLDSNGVAWGGTVTLDIDTGTTILNVITQLVENGIIEVRMVGRELRVYKPDGLGTDRTTGGTPTSLWSHLAEELPEQRDSRNLRTVAIVKGDEGACVEVVDAAAVATWGRRPMVVSVSGIVDAGTLTVIGTSSLAQNAKVRSERTIKYPIVVGSTLVPFRDYAVGDWVYNDMSGTPERVRVRQLTIEQESDEKPPSCTATLNDLFLEAEIALARQITGITGGSRLDSSAPGSPSATIDSLAPAQVVGVSGTSTAYVDTQGRTWALLTINWSAVTTNSDTTAITDLDRYEVFIKKQADTTYNQVLTTLNTSATISELLPNTTYNIQVRALDENNNAGAFSSAYTITTANDTTAPPVPKTPVVTDYLGQVRIFWDGLGSAGESMPGDFKWVEVHLSTSSGFTPSSATLIDTMTTAGYAIMSDLTYDTPYFVKFISVDNIGNKSAASAQATATPTRVSGIDVAALAIATSNLGDGAVTALKIADATITSAKIGTAQILNANIANAAIDDAKISSVSAGKITVGTLIADITVSARIKTANTGARAEMNSTGIEAYNAGGTRTFFVQAATGNVSILGDFKTGIAGGGSPYLSIDDSTDRTTISFWNSSGTKSAYINSVQGATTPQLGMNTGSYVITGSTQGYSRLFLQEGGIDLEIVRGSDQSSFGGSLSMNSGGADLRYTPLGGALTGGRVIVGSTSVELRKDIAGVSTGGKVRVDNTAAWIEYNNAGSGQHGFQFTSTGVLQYGATRNNISWSASPASGWSIGEFGAWKFGGIVVLHALVQRTGATITPTGTNVTPDVTCLTVSGTTPSYSPTVHWGNGAVFGEAIFNSDGTINIRSASEPIVSGTNVRLGCVFWDG